MTCEPFGDSSDMRESRLVVEILSPSTKGIDQTVKVPAYGRLPTVEEVWLVSSRRRWILVWRKTPADWIAEFPYTDVPTFHSPVLGGEVVLDRLYHLTGL